MPERKRPSLDQYFMAIAHTVASRSTCHDKQVGCVIVNALNNTIVSTGYNGPPAGAVHCPECRKYLTRICPAVHAEANAVSQIGLIYSADVELTAYCTLEPCEDCAEKLRAAGVTRVVFAAKSNKAPETTPSGIAWEHCPELKPWPVQIREYHHRLGKPFSGNEAEQMRHYCLAMFMEVAELTQSFQWKPWRAGYEVDRDNFLEEMADMLVFMDSLLMLQTLSWDDLFERLNIKIKELHLRIDNGYHTRTNTKGI